MAALFKIEEAGEGKHQQRDTFHESNYHHHVITFYASCISIVISSEL